jgi:tRNA modification GTPase
MTTGPDEEIIAAPGTALGYAAIGIVRLSGAGAVELADRVFRPRRDDLGLARAPDRMMTLGNVCSARGELLDEVLAVVMRGPHSYTRQDVVEIHCHGGLLAVDRILERVLQEGARLAEPGEFTRRAWQNGRLDLAQAEAVIDLIRARSGAGMNQASKQLDGSLSTLVMALRQQLRQLMAGVEAGIDFPEDVPEQQENALKSDLQALVDRVEELLRTARAGRIYREGLAVVLLGKPNVGKSTLLNRLLGTERALVTDIPGTTRDLIEEMVSIRGIPIRLVDTAGIRDMAGIVEALGIERAKKALEQADLVLAVFDAATVFGKADRMVLELLADRQSLVLLNKIDAGERLLGRERLDQEAAGRPVLEISARLGWGLQELEQEMVKLVGAGTVAAAPAMITRARHQAALLKVQDALGNALETINSGGTLDCVAVDLWDAWSSLGEILGEDVSGEIIDAIFQEFCIGK